MSNQNQKQKQIESESQNGNESVASALGKEYIAPETLAFDSWVNSTADINYMRLPKNDGGTIVAKFSNDKSKRRLVRRIFEDKKTGERRESIRAEYMVIDPNNPEKELALEVPKTLCQQIEKNIEKNHLVLEITRSGSGLQTRYMVVAE